MRRISVSRGPKRPVLGDRIQTHRYTHSPKTFFPPPGDVTAHPARWQSPLYQYQSGHYFPPGRRRSLTYEVRFTAGEGPWPAPPSDPRAPAHRAEPLFLPMDHLHHQGTDGRAVDSPRAAAVGDRDARAGAVRRDRESGAWSPTPPHHSVDEGGPKEGLAGNWQPRAHDHDPAPYFRRGPTPEALSVPVTAGSDRWATSPSLAGSRSSHAPE